MGSSKVRKRAQYISVKDKNSTRQGKSKKKATTENKKKKTNNQTNRET